MTEFRSVTPDDNAHLWLTPRLEQAAKRFGVRLDGRPVPGWGGRSLGSKVTAPDGPRWLRVVSEDTAWIDHPFWTGNQDSSQITDVPKPSVIRADEHIEDDRAYRAELMTFVAGQPCSPTPELRDQPAVSTDWWTELRAAIERITRTQTTRVSVTQDEVARRLRVFWGDAIDPAVTTWTTAHADLHWANLFGPDLAIVDWEGWGQAPAGYDVATLHAHSLLVPDIAEQVTRRFAAVLETHDGRRAELYAIARLLLHIEHGDHQDLAIPLHRRATQIVDAIRRD